MANIPSIVYAWVEFCYLRHTEQFDVADDELQRQIIDGQELRQQLKLKF